MTRKTSDEELVQRVAAGDRDALGELFDRHHRNIYALCCRMCGSEADAQDVTQDVFLRVLRHATTFSSRARVSTWLFQIARNACLTHERGRSREREKRTRYAVEMVEDAAAPAAPAESETGSPERLRVALEGLDPGKREVLMLKRYHDLSYQEIAEVCGCSAGAVRVRLHRALHDLRERYFDLGKVEAQSSPPDR